MKFGLFEENGADDEVRTRDIQIGNLKLYQLSYVRTGNPVIMGWARRRQAPDLGILDNYVWMGPDKVWNRK